MQQIITYIFLLFITSTYVACDFSLDIKKDIFNIYKNVAVEVKDLTHTNVTRDQITFRMYRKYVEPNEGILTDSNIKSLLDGSGSYIIFITHGWTHNADKEWIKNLTDAFLSTYPWAIIITVDWRVPANQMYPISAINVYDIGNFIGDMVVNLVDNHVVDIYQIILVGHSLGGQISGFAGKRVQKLGKKLPRIIALDPAGPLFDIRPIDKRLNPSDAKIVEVIHSDTSTFGFKDSCGTIDFFPNGGNAQPGCTRLTFKDFFAIEDFVFCDHYKSFQYFTEAVRNPTQLVAKQCSSWNMLYKSCNDSALVPLGDLGTLATGNFYLETNKEIPYNKPSKKTLLEELKNFF